MLYTVHSVHLNVQTPSMHRLNNKHQSEEFRNGQREKRIYERFLSEKIALEKRIKYYTRRMTVKGTEKKKARERREFE